MSEQTVTCTCPICGEPYVFYSHYAGNQSVCPDCRYKYGGSSGGQIIQCPICHEPYKFYSHYVGDQSACPSCREKARSKLPRWNN
ncbi:hypothetical protein LCGC14_0221240 [marine sediment metagenome]|uniref:Uncharacterized protein n=1 Tax=marine sediment metagenome TaxID=412755 RepID=A0A0F9WXU4_9ZZZZ